MAPRRASDYLTGQPQPYPVPVEGEPVSDTTLRRRWADMATSTDDFEALLADLGL